MNPEFEDQDLRDAVFWGVDLRRARLRDADLSGARMHNVWLVDVVIDGVVDRLVVNGVDVTAYVNEHDPWQPLRGMLRPTDVAGARAAWAAMERSWAATVDDARRLTDAQLRTSVDGEWSFVDTVRHLVFVHDKWVSAPFRGSEFHPVGIPNTGSADHPWPGIDASANPSLDETLAVRATQTASFRAHLDELGDDELATTVEVPENGTVTVLDCIHTVLEEEFEHRRYALRDLATLT